MIPTLSLTRAKRVSEGTMGTRDGASTERGCHSIHGVFVVLQTVGQLGIEFSGHL
jgi:hypothetical protein